MWGTLQGDWGAARGPGGVGVPGGGVVISIRSRGQGRIDMPGDLIGHNLIGDLRLQGRQRQQVDLAPVETPLADWLPCGPQPELGIEGWGHRSDRRVELREQFFGNSTDAVTVRT